MADEKRNVEILREAYAEWHKTKGGSVDHWMNLADDNIRFGSLAEGAAPVEFTRTYNNREALRGYFDGLLGNWAMEHYTVNEYIAQGDAVCVRVSTKWRNKNTGKAVETPKLDFWRLRGGKAVEFYEYYDTARLIAAAA